MIATFTQPEHMTLEEFISRFHEAPFELINGEIKPMSPAWAGGSYIRHILYHALFNNSLVEIIMETPFVLPDANLPQWVRGSRVPDVMVYMRQRLAEYRAETENWQSKPYMLVPDVVAEVVSKNDSYTDIQDKIEAYQQDGVQLIWIIDPARQKIEVYFADVHKTLNASDTLNGEGIIAGFEMPVASLFE
jgi:Uma2 family endonuclease